MSTGKFQRWILPGFRFKGGTCEAARGRVTQKKTRGCDVPKEYGLRSCVCLCGLTAAASAETFDVIIRHGTIIKCMGRSRYVADIAVPEAYIVKIGDLSDRYASLEIDATGQFVTPGIHQYSQPRGR